VRRAPCRFAGGWFDVFPKQHVTTRKEITMKFLTLVRGSEQAGPPPQELMEAVGQLGAEAAKSGVRVEMAGLGPSATGARIRLSRGKLTVTDGPFTEAKEVIGGLAIYEVESRAAAIEWGRRFMELHRQHWPSWEGECEIRQMF
jgi:hypothetical protein